MSNEYATVLAGIRGIKTKKMEQLAAMSPEYASLRDQYNDLCKHAIDAAVSGDGYERAVQSMLSFAEDMRLRQADILHSLGLPDDYLQPEYACDKCMDTGYIGGYERRLCTCARARLIKRDSDLEHMPRFTDFDDAIFTDKNQLEKAKTIRDFLMSYCSDFPNNEKPNLFFNSPPGLGKTFLLGCTTRELFERGHNARMLTAYELTDLFKGEHIEQKPCMKKLKNTAFLVIDDLGVEPIYKNISREYLFILLNERIKLGRHTAVSSNLTVTQLQEKYGDRIMSRIMDKKMGMHFMLSGSDLRHSGR